MLVLARKKGEKIVVGGGITIKIVEIKGASVRLGITAPDGVDIDRAEVAEAKRLYPRTLD